MPTLQQFMKKSIQLSNYLILVCLLVGGAFAAEKPKDNFSKSYSPSVNQSHSTRVYWGDTHLHTNVSADGSGTGNSLSPDEAYRFAKGETVIAPNGMKVRLRRPLDFLVIADHAVNMGVLSRAHEADPSLRKTEAGRFWYDLVKDNPQLKFWDTYVSKDFRNSKIFFEMYRLFHPNNLSGL